MAPATAISKTRPRRSPFQWMSTAIVSRLSKAILPKRKPLLRKRKAEARGSFDEWLKTATPDSAATQPQEGLIFSMPLDEGAGEIVKAKWRDQQLEIKSPNLKWAAGHVSDQAYKSDERSNRGVQRVGDFERDQKFSYGCWVRVEKGDLGGAIFARMNDQAGYRGWDLWMEGGRVGGTLSISFPMTPSSRWPVIRYP